jgi:hypothetical protein
MEVIMDWNIRTLIEKAMNIATVDKDKVIDIMVDSIKYKFCEKDTFEKIYREVYCNTLLDEHCDHLIGMLYNSDKTGAIWSIEDTNEVAKKLDYDFDEKPYTPAEFRAAMHIKYYENQTPLRKSGINLENTTWGKMADYYLTTDKDSKLVDHYFYLLS